MAKCPFCGHHNKVSIFTWGFEITCENCEKDFIHESEGNRIP